MSETQTILDAFRRVFRALRLNSHETQARCGLSGAQLFVLQKVGDGESLSVNEIAARTNTDQSSVSVVIAKLVAKRLLARAAAEDDRRKTLHTLTAAGRRLAGQSTNLVQDHLLRSIAALSATERAQLSKLIHKVVQGAELSAEPASLFLEDENKPHEPPPAPAARRRPRNTP